MIGLIFDIIHFIVVFVPILIFLFPKVSFHKYILLLIIFYYHYTGYILMIIVYLQK